MSDIWSYDNTLKSANFATADMAVISTGTTLMLVQSLTASYQRPITEVRALGDTAAYWVPGTPTGSMNVSKLVGDKGFLDGWKGKACGKISKINVSLRGGGPCGFKGSGSLSFREGLIENVSVSINAGPGAVISESATIRCADLSA